MKNTKYNLIYRNTSNQYQLVADTRMPIDAGNKDEMINAFNNFSNIESSKYSSVQIVAPGEIIKCDYIHNDIDLVIDDNFDIMDIFSPSISAKNLGKIGGKSKSAAKQKASRINGKLGGRPRHNC